MPSRAYHESLWEGVPEGLPPMDARLREGFLLGRVRAEGKRLGRRPRVLDFGCGEGHFATLLTRAGAEVLGVDVAEEPLRRSRSRHPGLDVLLVEPEAPVPIEDSSFDVVWMGETIEHIADTLGCLSELRRILRSGGVLLLSTPAHGPLWRLWLGLSPRAFRKRFDPRSDHLRFYTRRAVEDLLADFGFEEVVVGEAGGLPGARRAILASGRRKRF